MKYATHYQKITTQSNKLVLFLITGLFGFVALILPTATNAAPFFIRPSLTFESAKVHRITFSTSVRSNLAALHNGVDYYTVRYGQNEDYTDATTILVPGEDTEFTLRELQSGARYYVEVIARFNDGEYSWAAEEDQWTKPNRPRFLKVRRITPGTARFKWQLPYRTSWYTRHLVNWYTVSEQPVVTGNIKTSQRVYTLVDSQFIGIYNRNYLDVNVLTPGTWYAYRVKANILNNSWSAWSDYKHFRTPTE